MDILTTNSYENKDLVIWEEYHHDTMFILSIIGLLLSILIIISNCLTVVVLLKRSPFPPQTTQILISLTVADLLVGICFIGNFVSNGYCDYFKVENTFCTNFPFVRSQVLDAFGICSVLNTFIVAVDRYVAIFKPLRYHVILTSSRTTKLQLIAWILPIVYTSTYYIWWSDNPSENDVPLRFRISVNFGLYGVIGMFLCYMYIRILLIAKRHRNRIHQQNTVANQDTEIVIKNSCSAAKANKTNNMLIYMMVAYLLAWVPLMIMFCLYAFVAIPKLAVIYDILIECAQMTGYTNSGFNILIYIITHSAMRKAYRDTICFWKN